MLDLGFIVPLRKIVKLVPQERQTLFFSATMPKTIAELAGQILSDPVQVAVAPVASTVDRVAQSVMFVAGGQKQALLNRILADPAMERVLVFTRTKHGADKVVRNLIHAGIDAAAIHGNKSQPQRERALAAFKRGHDARARRDRHRGARHPRGERQPRRELRAAERAGELRAPDRADGARRRCRHRHLLLQR